MVLSVCVIFLGGTVPLSGGLTASNLWNDEEPPSRLAFGSSRHNNAALCGDSSLMPNPIFGAMCCQ